VARSLSARIAIAFVALAVALLVGIGGALFLVLRDLHADSANARLADVADGLAARARQLVVSGSTPREILRELDAEIPADVLIAVRTADGRIIRLQNEPGPEGPIDIDPTSQTGAVTRGSATDAAGDRYVYATVTLRNAVAGAKPRALVLSTPDRSAEEALRDVSRTLPIVALVLLIVGAPIGWLLARSIAGPLRRLSAATADVPERRAGALPVEGPTEVRDLTANFNAMTAEIDRRRREEADLLENLRHDLRTPLTVIGGFATALSDGTASGPDVDRAARAIGEETTRLGRMLTELDLVDEAAEAGALHPVPLDGREVVADAAGRFRERADSAGVTLVVDDGGGDSPLPFEADRSSVDRILANLVENALDAVPAGSTVTLAARPDPAPTRPRRTAVRGTARAAADAAVLLIVSDDGPGLPPGTRERVFERFFRPDPSRSGPGSGLGLAIVRELARAHGGDAWAEDVVPHGARLVVRLPATPPPGPVEARPSRLAT
jgi:two-component system, OmpR family, sensor kinase